MNQTKAEQYIEENMRLTLELEQAQRTIHDLNRRILNLQYELKQVKHTLITATAVGERGHACVAIDASNL